MGNLGKYVDLSYLTTFTFQLVHRTSSVNKRRISKNQADSQMKMSKVP